MRVIVAKHFVMACIASGTPVVVASTTAREEHIVRNSFAESLASTNYGRDETPRTEGENLIQGVSSATPVSSFASTILMENTTPLLHGASTTTTHVPAPHPWSHLTSNGDSSLTSSSVTTTTVSHANDDAESSGYRWTNCVSSVLNPCPRRRAKEKNDGTKGYNSTITATIATTAATSSMAPTSSTWQATLLSQEETSISRSNSSLADTSIELTKSFRDDCSFRAGSKREMD